MKISILAKNLSSNSLGRAHVLAEGIQRFAEVEIVGPKLGDGIWEPLQGLDSIDIEAIDSSPGPSAWRDLVEVSQAADGDVLYATKPYLMTFGAALAGGRDPQTPVLLDIDDWEAGFQRSKSRRVFFSGMQDFLGFLRNPHHSGMFNIKVHESLRGMADGVTVSNSILKEKFGGSVIPHAKDPERLDPDNWCQVAARRKMGLSEEETYVGFIGTPRPHKGVETLVKAVKNAEEVNLLLMGVQDDNYGSEILRLVQRELGGQSVVFPPQPLSQLPMFLSAIDIVVVPQRETPAGKWQLPSKLLDAMAMAKPIVSTDVSDIPEVLGEGGLIVPPDSAEELSSAIRKLAENPDLARTLGTAARLRLLENYTVSKISVKLEKVVSGAVEASGG